MGLDKIEKIVHENRDYFEQEPEMEHMNKFLFKLQEQKEKEGFTRINRKKYNWIISVAASVSILIAMSWFIIQHPMPQQNTSKQISLSTELYEIKTYYNRETEKKLKEIDECIKKTPKTESLLNSTKSQILKLDFNVNNIEDKLKKASGNERLKMAYIKNLKAKNDLVSQVYNEICTNSNLLTQ